MEYRVRWEIDISAESPEEAAVEALDCITSGDAKYFEVIDKDGNKIGIDLGEATVDVSKL